MTTAAALWRLIAQHPWLYLRQLILKIGRQLAFFAPGLIIREFLDFLTGESRLGWGVWELVVLLICIALGRIVVFMSSVYNEWTTFHSTGAVLRSNIFDHLINRPGATQLPFPPGNVVDRLGEDSGLILRYLRFTMLVGAMFTATSIAILIMVRIDWTLTLIILIPLILAAIVVNLASARIEKLRLKKREADGAVTTFLGELFNGVQAIQVGNAQSDVTARFNQLNGTRRKAALRDRLFSDVLMIASIDNIANITVGITLLLVGQSIRSGAFTIGDFSLFIFFMPRLTDFFFHFGQNLAIFRQTKVSLERLSALTADKQPEVVVAPNRIDIRGETDAPPLPANTAIEQGNRLAKLSIEGLTYRFPTAPGQKREAHGIFDISFSIKRKSLTVITGPIGSGKTTLLRVLLGLLPRDSGIVSWNGVEIGDLATFCRPPRVAYTPQVPRLFSDSLRNNILLGQPAALVDLPSTIELAVMARDVEQLEAGLETVIGPKGVKLSGGQVQRTAAARMFARQPELIVVDDLSSALDVETEEKLWRGILSQPNLTTLAVSHSRLALERADQVISLDRGWIEAIDTIK